MLICTLNDAENWHGHLAAFEQAYVTVEGGNTFTEELNQGCMLWSMVYSRSIPLVSSDYSLLFWGTSINQDHGFIGSVV